MKKTNRVEGEWVRRKAECRVRWQSQVGPSVKNVGERWAEPKEEQVQRPCDRKEAGLSEKREGAQCGWS